MGTLVYSKLVLSVPVTRKKKMPDIWNKLYVSTLSFLLATFWGGHQTSCLFVLHIVEDLDSSSLKLEV